LKAVQDSGYITNLITDEAERIINNNGNKKPLFLEISHLASHSNQNLFDPLEVADMKETNATFYYIKNIQRRKYAGTSAGKKLCNARVYLWISKYKAKLTSSA
jgi:hypothetical protein